MNRTVSSAAAYRVPHDADCSAQWTVAVVFVTTWPVPDALAYGRFAMRRPDEHAVFSSFFCSSAEALELLRINGALLLGGSF